MSSNPFYIFLALNIGICCIKSFDLIKAIDDLYNIVSRNDSKLLDFDSYSINIVSPLTYEIPCGVSPNNDRIVGGTNATEGQFPWLVSVQFLFRGKFQHVCAGSIINSKWIATGAHCTYDHAANLFQVKAGKHLLNKTEGSEQIRNISQVIIRKGFDIYFMTEDLALLKLNEPLKLNDRVAPICIPEQNQQFSGEGLVAGWGQTSENSHISQVLQTTTLSIISRQTCKNSLEEFRTTSMKCQICTDGQGKRDACMGDSGGPLMCFDGRFYLCGIVSWGIGCARKGYPGVYTEVSCYSDWMASALNATSI